MTHIVMASVPDLLKKAFAAAGVVLAMSTGTVSPSGAEEFEPLCDPTHIGRMTWDCWNPVEVKGHPGCHFRGALSPYRHAPPIAWSGGCRDGKADGEGMLVDDQGNRSAGRLVSGVKDGAWTTLHADGDAIREAYAEGTPHGPWVFDFSANDNGVHVMTYENGRLHGRWERRDADEYSEIGTFENGMRTGIWTISWPDGVEALVPYVDGEIHGEMTVTRDGHRLGTLVYREGRHVDGLLNPILLREPGDP
ncbi:MAG: hypothetical protein OXQ84_02150 [bacterium]|nr:hypothetical protein [bacterium]